MRRLVILLTLLTVAGAAVYYYLPREMEFDKQGIKYRLGDSQGDLEQSVRVRIEGKVYRSLLGKQTFRGTIDIEGDNLPVPESQRKLSIVLDRYHTGMIVYRFIESRKPAAHIYGMIHLSEQFDRVSFSIHEPTPAQSGSSSWEGDNGLMVVARAANREEALQLSNELMKDYWNGTVFR